MDSVHAITALQNKYDDGIAMQNYHKYDVYTTEKLQETQLS